MNFCEELTNAKTTLQFCNCCDDYSSINDMSITSIRSFQRPAKSIASFIFGTEEFNAAFAPVNIEVEEFEGLFCAMVLRPGNKFWLFHTPRNVLDMVNKVLVEATKPLEKGRILVNLHSKLNAVAFYLPTIVTEGTVSFGKRFLCIIFEGMHKLGYKFVTSTDTCNNDVQSTVIFEKCQVEQTLLKQTCHIMCIASKETNKLLLVRCPEHLARSIMEMISKTWLKGVLKSTKSESDYLTKRLPIWEFILGGEPWNSRGEQSTSARRLWLEVIRLLEKSGWVLYGVTRVNTNSIDSLFFKKEEAQEAMEEAKPVNEENNISILSLNRTDRLRLIDFSKSVSKVVIQTLSNFYEKEYSTSIGKYHGAIEFKLRGTPFDCQGSKSVDSHRLICNVLQSLTCDAQYDILTTIKVSDKVTSKSSFIMRQTNDNMIDEVTIEKKVKNSSKRYACISFSEKNKLRLINMPAETTERIIKMILEIYVPGIESQKELGKNAFEISLCGLPWSDSLNSHVRGHATSMLLYLLRELKGCGWKLIASADILGCYENCVNVQGLEGTTITDCHPVGTDSWFFVF